jgi:tryptophan 2,3-dioxygenase
MRPVETAGMTRSRPETYGDYLRVADLLKQQKTITNAHDELQFIVVHQVNELWFKLLLFELESTRDTIRRDDPARSTHLLTRAHAILRTVTGTLDVLETMRPFDFLAFRERLHPASGFQSRQFREIEFLSGLKDERYLKLLSGPDLRPLERRFKEPSIWDAYVDLLTRHGLSAESEMQIVASVIRILKNPESHPLAALSEALIEYDELFSLWRSRHVRMVMRMIGKKPGTGEKSVANLVGDGYDHMGSAGVDYLEKTLSRTFFPLLWEARTFIER